MLKPVDSFVKSAIGNIIYRKNLTTGVVKVINNNQSYDVEIGESGKTRKKIFTLSPRPDLAVGDKVRVLHKGGNREDMILLAPTKPSVVEKLIAVIVEQHSNNDYLRFYDLNGNLQNSYLLGSSIVYFETDCMAMDSNNNVYYIKNSNYLTKIDSGGNELLSVAIAGTESVAIGIDGNIYTREQDRKVHKRNINTFASQGYITLTVGKSYYGLVLDSDGNIYTVNSTDDVIEKWSPAGSKIASHAITEGVSSSLGLAGDYIVRVTGAGLGYARKIHKGLGSNEIDFNLDKIEYYHAAGSLSGNYLFTGEYYTDSNLYLEKYSTDDSLEWGIVADDSQYSPDDSLVAAYPF